MFLRASCAWRENAADERKDTAETSTTSNFSARGAFNFEGFSTFGQQLLESTLPISKPVGDCETKWPTFLETTFALLLPS